jgi:cobalt-zinc-cadmium efflux system protein
VSSIDTGAATVSQFAREQHRLYVVLAITIAYLVAELVGGLYANSLALLTDAVHMFTDVAALCLSLVTLWIAGRPATAGKTYGYLRAEILGALFNGLFVWLLVGFIWYEAAARLRNPPAVRAPIMIAVAIVGIAVNSVSAWLTYRVGHGARGGIALRAVFLHVVSDLIGSAGVLVAGAVSWFTGWHRSDPAVSLFIGALIMYGSWGLVREGVDILMESTPAGIDLDQLRGALLAVRGTAEVHDLHVWCLASHQFALSAHAVVGPDADPEEVLTAMTNVIEHKFKIRHSTLQLERDKREHQHSHL